MLLVCLPHLVDTDRASQSIHRERLLPKSKTGIGFLRHYREERKEMTDVAEE